jgi:hypothetical protein
MHIVDMSTIEGTRRQAMKIHFDKIILVLFVIAALLLGWGTIIKSLSGLSCLENTQPQAYYLLLAHI